MLDRSGLDLPYTRTFWVSSCYCKDKLSEENIPWERERSKSVDVLGSHFTIGYHGLEITIYISQHKSSNLRRGTIIKHKIKLSTLRVGYNRSCGHITIKVIILSQHTKGGQSYHTQ